MLTSFVSRVARIRHRHQRQELFGFESDYTTILQSSTMTTSRQYATTNSGNDDEGYITSSSSSSSSSSSTMEKIYSEWTLDDDRVLYSNQHLSTVRLASLLGRGMHGVDARLKKLSDVNSVAYARLFRVLGNTRNDDHTTINRVGGDYNNASNTMGSSSSKLTPVKEVLRRIKWDDTIPSSSFTILYYDRVQDTLCEAPFDAPNDSISGKETSFVFALPEHRIEAVKYRERTVWNKEMRLDYVFGSMNGNGTTIDQIIETYDEWKFEEEERERRNQRVQMEILNELNRILEERRLTVLKDLSSQLLIQRRGDKDWNSEGVRNYVKRVVGLYHEATNDKRMAEFFSSVEEDAEIVTDDDDDDDGDDSIEIVQFLYLFSDLVALLPDKLLREDILHEVESVIRRSQRDASQSSRIAASRQPPHALPELIEEELEEKFVKGAGNGGQKVNKTSNRVVLTHLPTKIRVECQDTRSLQQNRKIARKRLQLKVDEHLNGENSRKGIKASVAVAKKAKNKARNQRRRQNKE